MIFRVYPAGLWFSGLRRSAVDAAPPQLLLRRRFCTAVCRGRWRAQPSATKERYGCGPPLAGAHRPFCPVAPDCLFCGKAATVSPAARPHKLHIPRPAAGGRSRPFRCSSSPNCKRFAGLQFGSVWLVRKSRQKDALGNALYCALTRANFWPLRGLNALFGRRIVIFPIAFASDTAYMPVGADAHKNLQ